MPAIKLRASDAHRWMRCRASPGFVASVEDQLPKVIYDYTEDGIQAHKLAAAYLNGDSYAPAISGDMIKHVEGYVSFIKDKCNAEKTLFIEQEIQVFFDKSRKGFIDAAIIANDASSVYIGDLKYGQGVSVDARENEQLAIYSLSFIRLMMSLYEFKPETLITMAIYQPRIPGENPIRLWVVTLAYLEEFCAAITKTAEEIQIDPLSQVFAPSDSTCQFCPGQALCSARAAQLLGEDAPEVLAPTILPITATETPVVVFPAPATLNMTQLARIMRISGSFSKWLDKVYDHVQAALLAGQVKPEEVGYKLVAARTNRQWADEEAAEKFLRQQGIPADEVAPRKLISPAKAEEMLDKLPKQKRGALEKFAKLVNKPTGGPTIAPLEDKRPAWNDQVQVQEEFEVQPEGAELL